MDSGSARYLKKVTRRRFLKYGLRLSILSFLGFGFVSRNSLSTENYTLAFNNLPPAFENYRITQISDIHASFWVSEKYLNQVVERINTLPKDLTVITGDIITASVNDFWKRWLPTAGDKYIGVVINALRKLEEGPKIAVLGNHDHWDGKETEQRLVSELEQIGIVVLRNSSQMITRGKDKIAIAGTDDVWFTSNIRKALRGISQQQFTLLLSHSPDIREDMTKKDRIELTLCGHTHGGQVDIPFLSHRFIPIKNPKRYYSGLVKEPYGYTYVNRGIGTLVFPFRIGSSPEITTIRLKRA